MRIPWYSPCHIVSRPSFHSPRYSKEEVSHSTGVHRTTMTGKYFSCLVTRSGARKMGVSLVKKSETRWHSHSSNISHIQSDRLVTINSHFRMKAHCIQNTLHGITPCIPQKIHQIRIQPPRSKQRYFYDRNKL